MSEYTQLEFQHCEKHNVLHDDICPECQREEKEMADSIKDEKAWIMSLPWWKQHRGNLANVADYMLTFGFESEVPRMLEKPWNYEDMWNQTQAWLNEGERWGPDES